MEIRSRNILGSPVFAIDRGEKMGQVKDYVFHPEKKAIIALVIAGAKRFGEEKILPLGNIKSLGQEAITIADSSALTRKGEDPEITTYLKKMANIIGVNVITTNGGSLGRATDFFIDDKTGEVTCVALGGKAWDRLLKGNNFLPVEMIEVFGNDVILAKENAAPTTSKPKESKVEKVNAPEIKEAHSGSIWNQSKEKIAAKTKEYKKKIPVSAVFTEITKAKESPLADDEKKTRTKGKITYTNDGGAEQEDDKA